MSNNKSKVCDQILAENIEILPISSNGVLNLSIHCIRKILKESMILPFH